MDKGTLDFFSTPVAPVNEGFFEFMACKPLLLLEGYIKRMSVVIISRDIQRPNDYATILGDRNGYFTAKLIFLMLFTFADAYHFRFVEAIDLVFVMPLLPKYPLE
ncbi:hypothetical protein QN348_08105 [Mucilaginibacter sp. 5C4]|nr:MULTISPECIES: hypothetical protein [unclassified Mucilaginibacter]MEB0261563.1 hypothetical protein [Mucilaginibacter sp. 10I4]MEB0277185.1 hypothetical protein [Mucilaginibacter sp. 10B2]MEB0300833.1 hypothetical protein [Mucilaginibacter sp. 5C4]WPX25281.1 hypothetical protein RHM67_08395 [Mucilaginibacter sp. 5C4]